MLKRIPITIILVLFMYHLFCYFKFRNQIIPEVNIDKKEESTDKKTNNKESDEKDEKNDTESESKKVNNVATKDKFNYNDNLSTTNLFKNFAYGEPHKMEMSKDGPIYMWKFNQPVPWSKILHLPGKDFSYEFSFKVEIPSINHYQSWKKVIPNINFNPDTEEITIPCNDEEGALSVANLIINNFKNKISKKDIIQKNLINISIVKAKKFPIVKKKIKEQIIDMLTKKDESFKREADYEEDLAKAKQQQEDFGPSGYGGSEYSYL